MAIRGMIMENEEERIMWPNNLLSLRGGRGKYIGGKWSNCYSMPPKNERVEKKALAKISQSPGKTGFI
jgi:hypothetical protein